MQYKIETKSITNANGLRSYMKILVSLNVVT